MPRARGKANYKVELLIDVVEEKLPQGALGWQEVAALYQFRSQESVLRDYEDVNRHWTEKLCNKFKKPTGDPGDPVCDKILCCQRIHQKILAKSSSVVTGADSDEDEVTGTGSEDEAEDDNGGEEEEDYMEDSEIAWATTAAIYTTTMPVAATTATSRTTTPTAKVTTATTDSLIQNLASVSAAAAASASSRYDNYVIQDTQQDPDMTQLNSPFQSSGVQVSQEELSLHIRREELACHWPTPLVPRIQPGQLPPQNQLNQHQQYQQYLYQQQLQRTQQSSTATATATTTTTTTTSTSAVPTCDPPASTAKKQKKRRSEDVSPTPIPNQKTKKSSSEKRGSIVKSIDTLIKSIATDESDNKQASAASAAAFSQMQMQQMY
jgi:hypothetical protein